MYFPSLQHEAAHQPELTSGIHGGYRLVSTYDLPDCGPFWGLGGGVGGWGAKTENTQSAKKWLNLNFQGGYFGVNIGHLKSEVFHWGGGGFWSDIPERGFLENLDKNLLFSQKPAFASQIVSHILRMWRLKSGANAIFTTHK